MKKNDFLCINSLIYQIYNEPDFPALRRQALELIQTLIPCAFASFLTVERTEADGPSNDMAFEERLKKFMQDSDSRMADKRQYFEHKSRNRRR